MNDANAAVKAELVDVIDVHQHIVPNSYVKRLNTKGITKGLGVPLPKWSIDKTLGIMEENCIARAVLSISAPGVYFSDIDEPIKLARELSRETNEICANIVGENPDRFGAFATLPLPDVDAALEELEYALDVLKLDGVILLSNLDGYYLGDPRFEKLFAELNRRKAIVFVHPTTPPGIKDSHLGLPEAMLDVCFDTTRTAFSLIVNGTTKKYADIRFILAHAGGTAPYLAARVGMTSTLLANARGLGPVVADGIALVSRAVPGLKENMPELLAYFVKFKQNVLPEGPDFYLRKFYYDTALSAAPHALASLHTLVDSSRIVFGSDYVFATEAVVPLTIQGVSEYSGFSTHDLAVIANGSAAKLFPRFEEGKQ